MDPTLQNTAFLILSGLFGQQGMMKKFKTLSLFLLLALIAQPNLIAAEQQITKEQLKELQHIVESLQKFIQAFEAQQAQQNQTSSNTASAGFRPTRGKSQTQAPASPAQSPGKNKKSIGSFLSGFRFAPRAPQANTQPDFSVKTPSAVAGVRGKANNQAAPQPKPNNKKGWFKGFWGREKKQPQSNQNSRFQPNSTAQKPSTNQTGPGRVENIVSNPPSAPPSKAASASAQPNQNRPNWLTGVLNQPAPKNNTSAQTSQNQKSGNQWRTNANSGPKNTASAGVGQQPRSSAPKKNNWLSGVFGSKQRGTSSSKQPMSKGSNRFSPFSRGASTPRSSSTPATAGVGQAPAQATSTQPKKNNWLSGVFGSKAPSSNKPANRQSKGGAIYNPLPARSSTSNSKNTAPATASMGSKPSTSSSSSTPKKNNWLSGVFGSKQNKSTSKTAKSSSRWNPFNSKASPKSQPSSSTNVAQANRTGSSAKPAQASTAPKKNNWLSGVFGSKQNKSSAPSSNKSSGSNRWNPFKGGSSPKSSGTVAKAGTTPTANKSSGSNRWNPFKGGSSNKSSGTVAKAGTAPTSNKSSGTNRWNPFKGGSSPKSSGTVAKARAPSNNNSSTGKKNWLSGMFGSKQNSKSQPKSSGTNRWDPFKGGSSKGTSSSVAAASAPKSSGSGWSLPWKGKGKSNTSNSSMSKGSSKPNAFSSSSTAPASSNKKGLFGWPGKRSSNSSTSNSYASNSGKTPWYKKVMPGGSSSNKSSERKGFWGFGKQKAKQGVSTAVNTGSAVAGVAASNWQSTPEQKMVSNLPAAFQLASMLTGANRDSTPPVTYEQMEQDNVLSSRQLNTPYTGHPVDAKTSEMSLGSGESTDSILDEFGMTEDLTSSAATADAGSSSLDDLNLDGTTTSSANTTETMAGTAEATSDEPVSGRQKNINQFADKVLGRLAESSEAGQILRESLNQNAYFRPPTNNLKLQRLNIQANSETLGSVLTQVAQQLNLELEVSNKARWHMENPVSVKFVGTPFSEALDWLLGYHNLDYRIRNGVLRI